MGKAGFMVQFREAVQTTQERWSEFAISFVTGSTEVTETLELVTCLKNGMTLAMHILEAYILPDSRGQNFIDEPEINVRICPFINT